MKKKILIYFFILFGIINGELKCNLNFLHYMGMGGYEHPKLYPIPLCLNLNSICCNLKDQIKMLKIKIKLKEFYESVPKKIESVYNELLIFYREFINGHLSNSQKLLKDNNKKNHYNKKLNTLKSENYKIIISSIIKEFEENKLKIYRIRLNLFCLICDFKSKFFFNENEKTIIMSQGMCNNLLTNSFKFIYEKYKLYKFFYSSINYYFKILKNQNYYLEKNKYYKTDMTFLSRIKRNIKLIEECKSKNNFNNKYCRDVCKLFSFFRFGSIFEFNFHTISFFKRFFKTNTYFDVNNQRILISEKKIELKAEDVKNKYVIKWLKNKKDYIFDLIKNDNKHHIRLRKFIRYITIGEKALYRNLVRKKLLKGLLKRYKEFLIRKNQKIIDKFLNKKKKRRRKIKKKKKKVNLFYKDELKNANFYYKNFNIVYPNTLRSFNIYNGLLNVKFFNKFQKLIKITGADLISKNNNFVNDITFKRYIYIIKYGKSGKKFEGNTSPKQISKQWLDYDKIDNRKLKRFEKKINKTIDYPKKYSLKNNKNNVISTLNKYKGSDIVEFKDEIDFKIATPSSKLKRNYKIQKCSLFKKLCYYKNSMDFHCKNFCIKSCVITFFTDGETGFHHIKRYCNKQNNSKKIKFKKIKYLICKNQEGKKKQNIKNQSCKKKKDIIIPYFKSSFYYIDRNHKYNDADYFNIKKKTISDLDKKDIILKCNEDVCKYEINKKLAIKVSFKKIKKCKNINKKTKCIIFYKEKYIKNKNKKNKKVVKKQKYKKGNKTVTKKTTKKEKKNIKKKKKKNKKKNKKKKKKKEKEEENESESESKEDDDKKKNDEKLFKKCKKIKNKKNEEDDKEEKKKLDKKYKKCMKDCKKYKKKYFDCRKKKNKKKCKNWRKKYKKCTGKNKDDKIITVKTKTITERKEKKLGRILNHYYIHNKNIIFLNFIFFIIIIN